MSRTDAILAAIRTELDRHRAYLDTLDTLRAITLDVKLVAGRAEVRAVLVLPESEKVLTRRRSS